MGHSHPSRSSGHSLFLFCESAHLVYRNNVNGNFNEWDVMCWSRLQISVLKVVEMVVNADESCEVD